MRIRVKIPSVEKEFDFTVQEKMKIGIFIEEMLQLVSKKENFKVNGQEDLQLYDQKGLCLNKEESFDKNGIYDGELLLML